MKPSAFPRSMLSALAFAAVLILASSSLSADPRDRLAAAHSSLALNPVARPFTPNEIVGLYNRYIALPGAETLCPTTIQHISYVNNSANHPPTYLIPHRQIKHDGVACTDPNGTLVTQPQVLLNDSTVTQTLSQDTTGYVKGALASLLASTSSLAGFDFAPRVCGSAVGTPANTAWFFIDESFPVTLVPNVAVLTPGSRYLVLFALPPQGSQSSFIGCVYNTTSPSTSENTSSPVPTPKSNSSSSSSCFPASARVTLKSGAVKTMSTLQVGDVVAVGPNTYSTVFGFTHEDPDARSDFVRIRTANSQTLQLSPGHYLYVVSKSEALSAPSLAPAFTVKAGDFVELASGQLTAVVAVNTVVGNGLYNPQTISGDIIVDGVRTSTYTTAVEPALAHAALSPLRAVYNAFGAAPLMLAFGADRVASILPGGGAVF